MQVVGPSHEGAVCALQSASEVHVVCYSACPPGQVNVRLHITASSALHSMLAFDGPSLPLPQPTANPTATTIPRRRPAIMRPTNITSSKPNVIDAM